MMNKLITLVFCIVATLAVVAQPISAQSTVFTYQGSLSRNGSLASGNFDFEFRVFDAVAGGNQMPNFAVVRSSVPVVNGIFSVSLDFGDSFPGADRFLDIAVRQTGDPTFTSLSPRKLFSSTPYAIKSISAENAATANNAQQLAGVAADQYVITTDPRMSDDRAPTAGSSNYIQNQTTGAQVASNFNISGNGTAGGTLSGSIVNATTQYNIGGSRVLSNPGTNNLFTGVGAGTSNSTGLDNSFFGTQAGQANTTGNHNSFFGRNAGLANTIGSNNSFFGRNAGQANTTGIENAFFGHSAGFSNTSGSSNSFFGFSVGPANTTGSSNSLFGRNAGQFNTTGSSNSFFGRAAGFSNTTGNDNSFFGRSSGQANTTGFSNAFFGRSAGESNTTGGLNTFVGASAGLSNSTGASNAFLGANAGETNTTGLNNSFFGRSAGGDNTIGNSNSFFGFSTGLRNTEGGGNSAFGAGAGVNNTTGGSNVFVGADAGAANTTGSSNSFFGRGTGFLNSTGNNNTLIGNNADVTAGDLTFATAIGASSFASLSNSIYLGRSNGADTVRVPGPIAVAGTSNLSGNLVVGGTSSLNGNLAVAGGASAIFTGAVFITGIPGSGGSTTLCRNGTNQLSLCSSSGRYKTDIANYTPGLSLLKRLKPVSFSWKDGGMPDLGLVAEDVAAIEPLLVTYNDKGEIEGVKYDRVGVVLLNALKEQQQVIERQNAKIEALTKLVCASNADADICK